MTEPPTPLDATTLEALVRALESHSDAALHWRSSSTEADGPEPRVSGAWLPVCPSCGVQPRTVVQRFADAPDKVTLTFDRCGHSFSAGKAEIEAALRAQGS